MESTQDKGDEARLDGRRLDQQRLVRNSRRRRHREERQVGLAEGRVEQSPGTDEVSGQEGHRVFVQKQWELGVKGQL